MKLAIGVVTSHGFPIPADFWLSYEGLCTHLRSGEAPAELESFYRISDTGFPVDVARNQIVRKMLSTDADALLFLDCDHIMPPDLFDRLHAHGKDVITARYHVRRPPYHPNLYVAHPLAQAGHFKTVHYGTGCFEIDRGGAGALLIQRRVLEAIGDDWFRYQRNPTEHEPNDFSVSEDFWFYEQAQKAGFTCWADWDTEVWHLATVPIGGTHYDGYLRLMEQAMTPELARSIVVCGTDQPKQVGDFLIQPFRQTVSA